MRHHVLEANPRLQTFETMMLAEDENFAGLTAPSRALIGRA